MTGRRLFGLICGLAVAGAIFWFGYDLVLLIGGPGRRNTLTTLALLALMILVSVQVAARIGWGRWAEDETIPIHRWVWAIGISALVLVLSVSVG